MTATVIAVAAGPTHSFSKPVRDRIVLIAGLGVEGDAHLGETVRHRHQRAQDPARPNLRQVHLLEGELFDDLRGRGFTVRPGEMGENVTTRGIDLLGLPAGTRLRLGGEAVVEITGLRSPCRQIDRFQPGLMAAVLDRDAAGRVVRKAGVMAVVVAGGAVRPGDAIGVVPPPEPHRPLRPV
ncbi:MOSC domain-containing protein [Azospirillum sp. ST 5-10]|uniref:MOSC domain-containing protein n=1 Tax=unclassified Azospirillum TaxID=2630922 RepID=UPI003F4A6F1B